MRLKTIVAVGLLLGGVGLVLWVVFLHFEGRSGEDPKIRPSRGANLLLITLDTTRADHIGCYGGGSDVTPHMDQLAEGGVLFEQVYSTAPITLPSHASILTGLFPFRHGVRNNGMFSLPSDVETLATTLADEGYETAAFVSALVLGRRYGLGRGFDIYDDDLSRGRQMGLHSVPERRGDVTLAAAMSWLEERDNDRPFFCWFHLYDPHYPYEPPLEFRRRFPGDPYTAEIAFADHIVGQLLDALGQRGLLDRTAVSIVADHGEALGEHGEQTHAIVLHQATLRVPWIVAGPTVPAGRRIAVPVSTVDVAPTLARLVGAPEPNDNLSDGRPLLAGAERGAEPTDGRLLYAETFLPRYQYGWSPLRSVRRSHWELITGRRSELFHLDLDPRELVDVAGRESDVAADLEGALKMLTAEDTGPDAGEARMSISRSEKEALRALGYLGEDGRSRPDPPDPRDLVGAHTHMEKARHLVTRGQIRDAVVELDQMLEEDPGNISALTDKAELLIQQSRFDEARAVAERRLAADPDAAPSFLLLARLELNADNPEKALELARIGSTKRGAFHTLTVVEVRALNALDRFDEAVAVLDRALDLAPDDPDLLTARAVHAIREGNLDRAEAGLRRAVELDAFHFQARLALADYLEETGRTDEARALLEDVLRREPGRAEVLAALGRLHTSTPESAVPILEEAVRLNPSRFDPLFNLGLSYLRIGQPRKGEASLRRALALDPEHPGCRNNLAISLIMQGRLDEAEAELEELLREHPRFAEAYNNIAMVHIRREDWGEAERLARTAVDLDPEAVDPTMTLAGVLHQLGRYGEEIVTLKSLAVRHQERLDIVARYGVALAAAGDCSLALPQLSSALHEYFDETDVVIAAARCEEQQGDADRAIELFQRVAQVAPPGPIREEALGAVQRLALARR